MASLTNGTVNGHADSYESALGPQRFADIPPVLDIPVSGGEGEEAVEVSLEELLDDPTELCTLLENESVGKQYWMTVALAYAKQRKVDHAIEMLTKALPALSGARAEEKLSLLCCLCWLYLWKSREAPRIKPGPSDALANRRNTPRVREVLLTISRDPIGIGSKAKRFLSAICDIHIERGIPHQSLVPSSIPCSRRSPAASSVSASPSESRSWCARYV